MTNKHFSEYRSKLTFEAIVKSAMCGIGVGFGVGFVLALVFLLARIDTIWIMFVATFCVAAAAGAAFYFLRFRPNDVSNARRLDRLGLEERLVTMVELEGEDSYIAKIQREDAKASLEKLDKKQLKIKISKGILIFTLISFVLGSGMIVAKTFFHVEIEELLDDFIKEEFTEYVTVNYEADDGGTIDGEPLQDIVKGTDTMSVTAVADEGYMFKEWSDGYKQPTRFEQKVEESVTYTAIFMELEDEEGEENEQGGGDKDAQGESGGQSDEPGEGDQGAPDGEFNPNANAGGGQREPNNQIIDGETFYKEVLEYYQDLVNGQIEDNGGLTDEEIDLIKKYLGIV